MINKAKTICFVSLVLVTGLSLSGLLLTTAAPALPSPVPTPQLFTINGGWADTWDGMHSFLVFAPNGEFAEEAIRSIASRYGFGWGPKYRNALIAGNPSFVGSTQESATQDGRHDYAWVLANHPDWLLYACDQVTPILQNYYGAPTLDITNPEVIDYKFDQVNNGDNVAWDSFYLSNDFQLPNGTWEHACGVYDRAGNWVQKFAGIGSYADVPDPRWTDAMIAYAAAVRDRLHALPSPRLLIPNTDPKVVTGDPVRSANLIAAVDGLLVEAGGLDPDSSGDARMIWLRNIRFMEAMNHAGKAFYSVESPPSGTTIPQSYIQFTLASYFLAKGHSAALNIAPPGAAGDFNGMYWPPEFQAATAMGAPCASMAQVGGVNGSENGLFMREHSGGVSFVNPSTASPYTAALPAGSSYKDLYGNPVGSSVTIQPVTGLVLLKMGGAICSNEAPATPPATGDVTPPVISSISVTNITASTATVKWNTNEPAAAQLQFLTSCPSTGCLTPVTSTLTTSHTYNISGLLSDTFYTLQVRSRDSSGNLAVGSEQVFITAAAGLFPSDGPTLSVSPPSASVGDAITAAWSGIAFPMANDWIGLYLPGAANNAQMEWIYVSCSRAPGAPAASGVCPIVIPPFLSEGTYELRLLASDSYTTLATSGAIAVTRGGLTPAPTPSPTPTPTPSPTPTSNDDSPKGQWGRLTAIADDNHPNLFYNQSEIDELRNMILVQHSPQHLYDLYNTYMEGVLAVWTAPTPGTDGYETYRTDMRAAISYMIEPTSEKADAIRSALLSYMNNYPDALPDWSNGSTMFSGYSLPWLFDLLMAYHPEKLSTGEMVELKQWFAASAESKKFDSRDARAVSQSGLTDPPAPTLREGKLEDPFPNWYSRYMGPALAMALVSGNQADVDYFGDSGWPHGLFTFDGVTSSFPSNDANRYDLVTFLQAVYPSGANTDTYDREQYATQVYGLPLLADSRWYTEDYTWGVYHFAQMYGPILGAEMAYHNGMTGVFGIADAPGAEPALLLTYKRAIQSRTEIDSQPANPTMHPIIGWDPAIFAGYRRYSDSLIDNALPEIINYSGPEPNGGGNALRGFDVPGEVWQFFGYPHRPATP